MAKQKKPKKPNYEIIPAADENNNPTQNYRIMNELIGTHHTHLVDAKIGIAWRFGWKENVDGIIKLGQMRKASDLDRKLHGFDFVILLNFEICNNADFKYEHLVALIDHELCHGQVAVDKDGEQKLDANGHPVYRIRGHDIEEFHDIVARHGIYNAGLLAFCKVAYDRSGDQLVDKSADTDLQLTHPAHPTQE